MFGGFCVDGERRALTLDGRELLLQPKAFDLLLYLLERRGRVVGKEELLDALWPGVVVSEGSLKRAVSLVRSALQEGGAEDMIRTYHRQGYRFCSPGVIEAGAEGARTAPSSDVQEPEALERAGLAAHHGAKLLEALVPLQRAVAAYAERGDRTGAARCSFHLAQVHFEQRELVVGRGWMSRGSTYLTAEEPSVEHGHRAWLASRYAAAQGDIDEAVRQAELARAIGRSLGDANLEALGLLYKGLALVALGEVQRGCAHHDEAAAAVLSTDVSPWVSGLVYCGMIFTCRNRADWRRASEWTHRFSQLSANGAIAAFTGTCRLHRAEVLYIGGAVAEAEREAMRVSRELASAAPWAEGDAYDVLGDLHLARGDLDGAEEAYRRARELGWDPQPGLARLLVARGKARAGLLSLQRSLSANDWTLRQRRGTLLANLVHVALAAGDREAAREAARELELHPALWQTPALEAAVSEAKAAIYVNDGDAEAAQRELNHAVRLYCEIGSPLNAARARVALAESLLAHGDDVGAELELDAASRAAACDVPTPLQAEIERVRARLK